ncbi:HAD family hydrolase [Chitinimonas sp.]|uniref:HAD family hydrolase n=1 Tax=Chitinimonas sp. TaxID=1934313 RepID=UPI0035B43AA8
MFDLDGTLISAAERQSCLMKAIAGRYGINLDADVYWRLKRAGDGNVDALLGMGVDLTTARRLHLAWLRDVESPYWLSFDSVFEDTVSSLEVLVLKGASLHLVTARRDSSLMVYQIQRLGIFRYFRSINCVSPERAVEEKRGVILGKKGIVLVGDSEIDFKAAQVSGCEFHAVSTGQRSSSFLSRLGGAAVWSSLTGCISRIADEYHG